MARGGKRQGAGRKKGVKSKRKVIVVEAKRAPADKARVGQAQTPLEYMLSVMRDRSAPFDRRDEMAKAAAPYVHERMAPKSSGKKAEAEEAARTAGAGSGWGDLLDSTPARAN